MKKELIRAIKAFVVFSFVCSLLYPFFVWLVGYTLFHEESKGSLVTVNEQVVGSTLIAQKFTSAKYFHARPSCAGIDGYDASSSGASNQASTSKKRFDDVAQRVNDYRTMNLMSANQIVPQDAVTASASGLDPHISVSNAIRQSHRVCRARNINIEDAIELINECIERPFLGFFGDKRVNVLKLNLLLDEMQKQGSAGS